MKLSQILGRPVSADPIVSGVCADSRQVRKGYVFFALPGVKSNGRTFIQDAVRQGAAAIVTTGDVSDLHDLPIPVISDDQPRRLLSHAAAAFFGHAPSRIVAVTGTNGKTSTVNFVQQLWTLAGLRGVSMGTLGIRGGGYHKDGGMTTPDPVVMHADLADLAAAGFTHLAMEASSHGLHQYRLDGLMVQAAAFTNLTRDHLDYHGTMEEYRAAKLRLFSDILLPGGTAVINADAPDSDVAIASVRAGARVWTYGVQGSDIKLLSRTPTPRGQDLALSVFGKSYQLTLPLVGGFQVMNVLAALGLCLSESGADADLFVSNIEKLSGVPGRLELVGAVQQNAAVYVDYAHTPDALENVLQALRPHTQGRLVCLFGCGGDRDRGKRAVMGRIAAQYADSVIITDDNPRSEDAASIRHAIAEGAPDARVIPGRRDAIFSAVAGLRSGDVLVVAGKGHEQGQIIGDQTIPFDDVQVSIDAIREANATT